VDGKDYYQRRQEKVPFSYRSHFIFIRDHAIPIEYNHKQKGRRQLRIALRSRITVE
jgi:hypothetical protein